MSDYESDDNYEISNATHDHYMAKKKTTRYGGPPKSKAISAAVGGFQSQFTQNLKRKQEAQAAAAKQEA
jgi:hypothetical protein